MSNKKVVLILLCIITLVCIGINTINYKKVYVSKIKPIDNKLNYYKKLKIKNSSIKRKIKKEEKIRDSLDNRFLFNKEKIERLQKIVYEKEKILNGKLVYLTFDDGPSIYTDEILNILDKYNIKATFFVVCSNNLEEYAKKYIEKGHTIGLHSCTHKYNYIYSSENSYFEDINNVSNMIETSTGYKSKIIRFPGGSSNTVSKFNKGIMTRIAVLLKQKDYKYYDWNIDSNDAAGADSNQIYYNVINSLSKKDKDMYMILMHDTKASTKDALEKIIVDALNMGYIFSNIDEYTKEVHHIINN